MALRITIIGGLPDNPDRNDLLDQLRARTREEDVEIEWEWIKAEPPHWNVPPKLLGKMLGAFRNPRPEVDLPVVVKLSRLHGRDENAVYRAVKDPKLAPQELQGVHDLIEWLFSPETRLIPRTEWCGCLSETALAALLSKLIKNKSWNNDQRGHAWTNEADLLGQSPVQRSGFGEVRTEAADLLRMGDSKLFLSKGGKQGKTPKEWCIKLEHVPLVKQMVIARSFKKLNDVPALAAIHRRLTCGDEPSYRIDGEIITERVLHICRD